MARVLIVDDEKHIRETFREFLIDEGHQIDVAEDAETALRIMDENDYDVVVSDILLPRTNGIELVNTIHNTAPAVQVILVTGQPTIEGAAAAVRSKAFDYLVKPVKPDDIRKSVAAAERVKLLNDENRRLNAENLRYQKRLEDLVEERTKEALEKEKQYRALYESSPDGIMAVDVNDLKIIDVNPTIAAMLGRKKDELVGDHISRIFPENRHDAVMPEIEAMSRGQKTMATRTPCLRSDGEIIYVDINSARVKMNGRDALLGYFRDVTEYNQAEANLWQSIVRAQERDEKVTALLERFEAITNSAVDGIISFDASGTVIEVNDAAVDLFGYSREQFVRKSAPELICESQRETLMAEFGQIVEKADSATIVRSKELLSCKSSGEEFPVELSLSTWKTMEGRFYTGIIRNVTERHRAEAERMRMLASMERSQKMESLSTLAGGIAHDFNNIFTAIIGNITFAKIDIESGTRAFDKLSQAESALIGARELTDRLVTFAVGGASDRTVRRIDGVVQEAVGFALHGSNTLRSFNIPGDLKNVEIDEARVLQAIGNLVINADQACRVNGKIIISAENSALAEAEVDGLLAGDYLKISISDNGDGISPEILPRIFDPYFSTREGAAGLGLSVASSIINSHKGTITVDSTPGDGATFNIYLPASELAAEVSPEETRSAANGGLRLLLMDDEQIILSSTGDLLVEYGFKVVTAKNGEQAISKFNEAREAGEPFDVVVLDLTIAGGMGGKETISRLIEIDPEVKAIVSSGYANDPIIAGYRKHGFSSAVSKPYAIRSLIDAIEKLAVG